MLSRIIQKNRGIIRNMKIETEKKDGKLHVTVTLPAYYEGGKRLKINLISLLKILEEKNIKHGRCIHPVKVTNRTPNNLKGTFIFELFKPTPKSRPKPRPKKEVTRSSLKKMKKKLDTD